MTSDDWKICVIINCRFKPDVSDLSPIEANAGDYDIKDVYCPWI